MNRASRTGNLRRASDGPAMPASFATDKAKAGHWPQYEAPEEFNDDVTRKFLTTGSV